MKEKISGVLSYAQKLVEQLKNIEIETGLDIATRNGAFAAILAEHLKSYSAIYAIDTEASGLEVGREKYSHFENFFLEQRDGYASAYPDKHFDLVAVSNSLHHFEDLPRLFTEIRRILAEDGILLINELPADHQSGAPASHAQLHGWDVLVDSERGVFHGSTIPVRKIEEIIEENGFQIEQAFLDQNDDPALMPPLVKRVNQMEDKLEKIAESPLYQPLRERMAEIAIM